MVLRVPNTSRACRMALLMESDKYKHAGCMGWSDSVHYQGQPDSTDGSIPAAKIFYSCECQCHEETK